ncbi:PE-PPE domain-containing protein [Tsukamurella soli]|uniref:PE-PPE domain-containing protein n=1 Tax=Tsukamurella soli TaxID=644556 RepID=A0ABP8KG54_9ACTN
MRTARPALLMFMSLLGVVALSVGSAVAGAVAGATTVLVVPGTGTPDPDTSPNYEANAIAYYVAPSGGCATACTAIGVPYVAQFWPFPFAGWGGLSGAKWNDSVASGLASVTGQYSAITAADPGGSVVVFGYSQGATVVSQFKSALAADGGVPAGTSFVLIANPNRPNGGLFERLAVLGTVPILDATFGEPTPTDTSDTVDTTDIAFQYDGVSDFPTYPINLLADANALAGFWYIHGTYLAPKGTDAADATPYGYTPEQVEDAVAAAQSGCNASTNCQISGDTEYITLPAKTLPLLQPLIDLGTSTGTTDLMTPAVDLISPALQVLIETGYDRTDYGVATPAQLVPVIDPITLGTNLAAATAQGVQAAANDISTEIRGSTTSTPAAVVAATSTATDSPAVPLTGSRDVSAESSPGAGASAADVSTSGVATASVSTAGGSDGQHARAGATAAGGTLGKAVHGAVDGVGGAIAGVAGTLRTGGSSGSGASAGSSVSSSHTSSSSQHTSTSATSGGTVR